MKTPLPFYRESAATVLKTFESQASGLSEAQAQERRRHTEQFTLPHQSATAVLPRSVALRFVLLLFCFAAAIFAGAYSLAIILLLASILFGFTTALYKRTIHRTRTVRRLRLATSVKVVRNSKITETRLSDVAAGDIIYLEVGDIVPADMRIIKASSLVVEESIFNSFAVPTQKHATTISEYVARDKQTNMLFFGTTITKGSTYGMVVALGKHTELGRMFWTPKKAPILAAHTRLARLQQISDACALILIAGITAIAITSSWTLVFTVSLIATVIIATSLFDAYSARIFIAAHYAHKLGRKQARVLELSSLEAVGTTRTLLTDLRTALTAPTIQFETLYIGSKPYTLQHNTLTKTEWKQLSFAQEVIQLTARLPIGAQFAAVSPPSDTTAVYEYVSSPTIFDDDPSLHTALWKHNQQMLHIIQGDNSAILKHATHIWDHGHVRPLTAKDRASLQTQTDEAGKQGNHVFGFAYSHSDPNAELVYIALLSGSQKPETGAAKAVSRLARAHIGLVLVSDESQEQTYDLLQKSGFEDNDYILLTHDDIQRANPPAIAELSREHTLVLQNVTAEDIRITSHALQRNGQLTVVGDRLEIPELLGSADVVLGSAHTLAADYASIVIANCNLSSSATILLCGRKALAKINGVMEHAPLIMGALVGITLLSIALNVLQDIPPITTPFSAIALLLILLPVVISSGWDTALKNISSLKPATIISARIPVRHFLLQMILLVAAPVAAFCAFFLNNNIEPGGLSSTSTAYQKAVTAALLTLALCLIVQCFISRSVSRHAHNSDARKNTYFWFALVVSISLLYAFAYSSLLQNIFQTSSPLGSDWFIINCIALTYVILAAALHFDRHHTRSSIVHLHKSHTK